MANGRNGGRRRRSRQVQTFPTRFVSAELTGDPELDIDAFVANVEKALRSAAYAGAKVLYDEMCIRVPVVEGELKKALYHWYDQKQSGPTRQVYAIGVNKAKAPHWHWLEFGHWRHYVTRVIDGKWVTLKKLPLPKPVWVPADPYIRPAYDAKIVQAMEAAKKRFGERLLELAAGGQ